jgi:hypothetical protein
VPSLELNFELGARALTARGDIAQGWGPWQNGFGFFGRGSIPFRDDWRLDVNLHVLARPNYLAYRVPAFPSGLWAGDGVDSLNYKLQGSVMTVYAEFTPHLEWLDDSQKPGVKWYPSTPIPGPRGVVFYINLLVVFNPPREPVPRDIIERDLLPYLSGQFESNRRKH